MVLTCANTQKGRLSVDVVSLKRFEFYRSWKNEKKNEEILSFGPKILKEK